MHRIDRRRPRARGLLPSLVVLAVGAPVAAADSPAPVAVASPARVATAEAPAPAQYWVKAKTGAERVGTTVELSVGLDAWWSSLDGATSDGAAPGTSITGGAGSWVSAATAVELRGALSVGVGGGLRAFAAGLGPGVRWMASEQVHLGAAALFTRATVSADDGDRVVAIGATPELRAGWSSARRGWSLGAELTVQPRVLDSGRLTSVGLAFTVHTP